MLHVVTELQEWWHTRALWSEGRRRIEQALATDQDSLPIELRAEALRVAAALAIHEAELDHALDCGQRALAFYRAFDAPCGTSRCLTTLAAAHLFSGELGRAHAAASEAVLVARQTDDDRVLASALHMHALTTPDLPAAETIAAEAAALLDDAADLAELWGDLGYSALVAGAVEEADELLTRSLDLCKQIDDPVLWTYTLGSYALVALANAEDATAAERFRETLTRCQAMGLRRPVSEALTGLAAISARSGDVERAARLVGASTAARHAQPPTPVEQRLYSSLLDPVLHVADNDAWLRGRAAGGRLSIDSAITLGIETADRHAVA
jgi:tetratricopeptide (TPR) repeat protein